MTVIEFQRTIGESEARYGYINLTDDDRVRYGAHFPEERTPLWIVTEDRQMKASIGSKNQIWGSAKAWFEEFDVRAGDTIKVTFDKSAKAIDGRWPVGVSIVGRAPHAETDDKADTEDTPPAEVSVQMEEELEDFLAANLGLIETGLQIHVGKNGRS